MKALILAGAGKIELRDVPIPEVKPGCALVKIKAIALNRRDEWIREGKYPKIKLGAIMGSDGAGVVEKVHDEDHQPWVGQEVIINPNIDWGDNPNIQSRHYTILGMPVDGTFAEYISIPVDRLHHKPFHLDLLQAAAFPMGGLTAYRALFKWGKLKAKKNVLISGFGGGVAQFAFLFAKAAEANVYITSGSDSKLERARKLGAMGGFNYKRQSTLEDLWRTKGGFDLVIDSAGGDQLNNFIKMMKPQGKIVFYGATNGLPSKVDLYRMFWNQITLQGSTMGNDDEFSEMLAFVGKNQIKPLIDSIRPFSKIIEAFDDVVSAEKVGKIVFQV
ncbi:MAG: zinc-binding dehydrogenase [Flammeovirgaceae bacterium]|nr:zinc-binding dehydrogenase [Flammeovirgaceae bacterium]